MDKRLPRVGEIWKGVTNAQFHIIITKYLEDKTKGDLVEYEIIEQNHTEGVRYATAVMNYCTPVSYYDGDSKTWIITEK